MIWNDSHLKTISNDLNVIENFPATYTPFCERRALLKNWYYGDFMISYVLFHSQLSGTIDMNQQSDIMAEFEGTMSWRPNENNIVHVTATIGKIIILNWQRYTQFDIVLSLPPMLHHQDAVDLNWYLTRRHSKEQKQIKKLEQINNFYPIYNFCNDVPDCNDLREEKI